MSELILREILKTLREIQEQLAGVQSENTLAEARNTDIMSWIDEKNAVASEEVEVLNAPSELGEAEEEVIFNVLDGVDASGLEAYIGKPMSEVDEGIIQMIARPDYATRFAPKKFPQEVIDAAIKIVG